MRQDEKQKGDSQNRGCGIGNGICERFQKTVLNEFYRVVLRRTVYAGVVDLQRDLDQWVSEYNEVRPHQGRWCYGKTPMQTFRDSVALAKEKQIA